MPEHHSRLSRREFLGIGLWAVGGSALLACDSPTALGDPRLTARPGEPTVPPVVGRTSLGLGGERDGFLYVPEIYDPAVPAPLVVALHGAGQSSDLWTNYPARYAEPRGTVLLAPDSRAFTWDLVFDTFGPDVAFLDRALAYTFRRCRIDPAHVCLAGFSDGASYALSLGVSNGDLFTHLVAYSPGFFGPGPSVGLPRVFVSHGTGDPILPVRFSREDLVPRLNRDGYDVTYREFDGGHEVPAEISQAAFDWFRDAG